MKRLSVIALAVVTFAGTIFSGMEVQAYNDPLLGENPKELPMLGTVVLVPTPSPEVKESVHLFVKAWQNANMHVVEVKEKVKNGETLTDVDRMWLESTKEHTYNGYFRTHSIGRVHGFEVSHNWNAENKDSHDYRYMTFSRYSEEKGYTNSYGFNVLRGMVDRMNELMERQAEAGGPMTDEEAARLEEAILAIMEQDQEQVANEELRHYMNETVWFTTMQTMKDKAKEEPTETSQHVVNLWQAINK